MTSLPTAAAAMPQYESGEDSSPCAWIKTPKGILRILECFFSVIMFGTMADVSGFDHYDAFKFQVAVGVLLFLYTLTLIVVYIFRRKIEQSCLYLPIIELALDGILCVLLFASSVDSAVKCNESIDLGAAGSTSICSAADKASNIKASIAFGFISFVCMLASTFFSYKENVAEEKKPG